jgi:hypothetical protein
MSACMKSRFGSCIAMASTDRDRRLMHIAWSSAKSSLMEMPLALIDHTRKESGVLCSKGSPLGMLGGARSGGGRVVGGPPGALAVSTGRSVGLSATKESRKNVRQASFSRLGLALGRNGTGASFMLGSLEDSDCVEASVEEVECSESAEDAVSTDESSSSMSLQYDVGIAIPVRERLSES